MRTVSGLWVECLKKKNIEYLMAGYMGHCQILTLEVWVFLNATCIFSLRDGWFFFSSNSQFHMTG